MCLNTVTKSLKPAKLMRFYKVMDKLPGGGYGSLYGFTDHHRPQHVGGKFRKCGRQSWPGGQSYPAGFHGYMAKYVALSNWWCRWAVVECEGHVHTLGKQSDDNACVARDMRILRVIRDAR